MQRWWSRYQHLLNCNQLGSSVKNGNILRLALEKGANEFINDATRRWRLDLNAVDQHDGATALDYVDRELSKSRGTTSEAIWQRHKNLLIQHGAKPARDLP